MDKSYKTVLENAVAEVEEKKSRFIASVKPITSEEEAIAFIQGLKSKYWDATHNVYAYHLGGDMIIQRYSDDGEPSGTAGLPMMEVIKRMEVRDLVIVVTRYFGGTLLGAAGLIRAYGKSAAVGIEAAKIITRKLCGLVRIIVEYTLFGKVQNTILNEGYIIKETKYEQDVEVLVYVPVDEVEGFLKIITEVTNARVILDVPEKEYISIDSEGKLIG